MTIPKEYRDLYAHFGMAAEKAQVVELEAGNVALSYLALWLKTDETTPELREVLRGVLEDCNRSTLGRLLNHVKKIGNLDESILRIIDDALASRNHLMHHFFRTHNLAILTEDGRMAMIDELEQIHAQLTKAHNILFGLSSVLDKMAGKDLDADLMKIEHLMAEGKKLDI